MVSMPKSRSSFFVTMSERTAARLESRKFNSPQRMLHSLRNRNPDVINSHVSHKTAHEICAV